VIESDRARRSIRREEIMLVTLQEQRYVCEPIEKKIYILNVEPGRE
jgi:hypothetical protein